MSGVSQTVFRAFLCVVYDEESETYSTRSFLRADPAISCDGGDDHARIKALAYAFILVWPVGVPLLYTALLLPCAERLRSNRSNELTRATHFLHGDYKPGFYCERWTRL